MKKLLVCLVLAFTATAWGKSYSVTLFQPATIGGTELKPGPYKLEVKDNKMVLRNGKQSGEAKVRVEQAGSTCSSTSVRFGVDEGKYRIQEICIGGSKMKFVVEN